MAQPVLPGHLCRLVEDGQPILPGRSAFTDPAARATDLIRLRTTSGLLPTSRPLAAAASNNLGERLA
ncbi:hypothetical protein [Streptomyces sp. NPDC005784]|uniref:hypothetical protein n=1 Tax=Streptomyces sp. NPDC005784 TaxID=3364731 RepID=UPI0036AFB0F2